VKTFGATTAQILALVDYLLGQRVTTVVMEASSDYWKPFYCTRGCTRNSFHRLDHRGSYHKAPGGDDLFISFYDVHSPLQPPHEVSSRRQSP
jgi:hypothetical protein